MNMHGHTESSHRASGTRAVLVAALVVLATAPSLALAQEPVRHHALVIGLNSYISSMEGVPTLNYAVPDAMEVDEILEDRGFDTRRLVDEDATRENIVAELYRLAREARPQDTVLVYFAGHGVRSVVGSRDVYWLTYYTTLSALAVHGIRLSHLLDYVRDIPAARKIVILDHCHSGDVKVVEAGIGESGGARAASGAPFAERNVFPVEQFQGQVESRFSEGLVVLGAARQEAYEFDDLKHGLLTHVLIRAMTSDEADTDGDGALRVDELRRFVRERVAEIARERNVEQSAIDIVRGVNPDWNVMTVPLDDFAQVMEEADALKKLITDIDVQETLQFRHKMTLFQAIRNWTQAVELGVDPDPRDLKVVQDLREIRALGTSVDWSLKKEMLESLMDVLASQ